jgi:hypothetical protein
MRVIARIDVVPKVKILQPGRRAGLSVRVVRRLPFVEIVNPVSNQHVGHLSSSLHT